ncbi:MAG: hypothetical protein ABI772_05475 [Bacteroidota bacterium]
MARDFTLKIYIELVQTIARAGYTMTAYEDFVTGKTTGKQYILRHDVDNLPLQSLRTAEIEKANGARGTYYFRIVKQSNHPHIIEAIAKLGHEIGYHYEDLALAGGNFEKAYENYLSNLAYFRKYYPVTTICMHGSPLSKWDNRRIWEKYDYKKDDIIAEPYFDTDFSKVFYLTDTSRHWNGNDYSVRDKVTSPFNIPVEGTLDLINKIKNNKLPSLVMQNIHPQRWSDDMYLWTKELVLQNMKNVIKKNISKKHAD